MSQMKRGELIQLTREHISTLRDLWVTARVDGTHIEVVKVEAYMPGCEVTDYYDVSHVYQNETWAPDFFGWIREYWVENRHRHAQAKLEDEGMAKAKEGA